ncbi:hypothetical protein EV702DRAFT_1153496, partial [Suillus placidus]
MLSGLANSAQTGVTGSKTSSIAADITHPSSRPLSPKPVTPAPFSQGAKKLTSTSRNTSCTSGAQSLSPSSHSSSTSCSNHGTYRLGRGICPKRIGSTWRVWLLSWINYAIQLAEQYGTEIASDIVARSRHLGSMTYNSGIVNVTGTTYAPSHGRYDCMAMKLPSPRGY